MRRTELHLTKKDRRLIAAFRAKGMHSAREFNRAHVLAALDRGLSEAQIMAVLGVGRTAIWRTRAAYLQGGLEYALHDVARPGKPRQYDTDVEAQMYGLGLLCTTDRRQALDLGLAGAGGTGTGGYRSDQPRNHPPASKKNWLKPWRRLMWCVGVLDARSTASACTRC